VTNLVDPGQRDATVRLRAFAWLREQVAIHGDVLPRDLLAVGFEYQETRVPLLGPQGIFKPAVLPQMPLSITTAPDGPYDDSFGPDDRLLYRYRGRDPQHRDNVGLRLAMQRQAPLVYFHGVVPGRYLAVWPVFVVGDQPENLTFKVAADDVRLGEEAAERAGRGASLASDSAADGRRAYITTEVRQRLHQRGFRERVLRAYRDQCAFCRLRHRELLDAGHIVPDSEPGGLALVRNGLAMCKIHHAAYDLLIIGIRPDYIVEVRPDVLREEDGPMLRHGLQGLHQSPIELPRSVGDRPDPELLAQRFARFRGAA
jgi:putative restriction endonuclease